MLMPSELPNWLLFRPLRDRALRKADRSNHFFRWVALDRLAIHKLFHSGHRKAQLESPKVLTSLIYRKSCMQELPPPEPLRPLPSSQNECTSGGKPARPCPSARCVALK